MDNTDGMEGKVKEALLWFAAILPLHNLLTPPLRGGGKVIHPIKVPHTKQIFDS